MDASHAGKGTYLYADGDSYVGDFLMGKRQVSAGATREKNISVLSLDFTSSLIHLSDYFLPSIVCVLSLLIASLMCFLV